MSRTCSLTKHVWSPMRGGKRERCDVCKTVFPCHHACGHLDCLIERGDPLPDWIVPVPSVPTEVPDGTTA